MPFTKDDPNINRKGRPRNAEIDILRQALIKEGEKRGIDFWEKVAQFAFTNDKIMVAILKKFVPDLQHTDIEGEVKGGDKVVVLIKEKDGDKGEGGRLPTSLPDLTS